MLSCATVVKAQSCGTPPPTFIFSSPTMGELTVMHSVLSTNSNLSVKGENFSLGLSYRAAQKTETYIVGTSAYIHVSNSLSSWGSGVTEIMAGGSPLEEPPNLTMMKEPWKGLWNTSCSLAGELSASSDFWDFIGDEDAAKDLTETLEAMRDGKFAPTVRGTQISIDYFFGLESSVKTNPLVSGYDLRTPSLYLKMV
ncbi:MAG: hypothetical protein ABIF08_00815, partial [Nanoarchaeota archaeon]